MASNQRAVLNAPNLVSLSRVALTPVLVWLASYPGRAASAAAAFAFFIACLSDWLDGYLARTSGQVTNLGKFLDPLADKILVLGALIMLCSLDREPRVPAWLVVVITAREVAVTGLRAIARDEGIVLGAEALGKAKAKEKAKSKRVPKAKAKAGTKSKAEGGDGEETPPVSDLGDGGSDEGGGSDWADED